MKDKPAASGPPAPTAGFAVLGLAAIVFLAILLAAVLAGALAKARGARFSKAPRGGGGEPLLRELSSPEERGAFLAAALQTSDLDPAYGHWLPAIERRLAERERGRVPGYMELANHDRQEGSPGLVPWEDKGAVHGRLEALGLPHARVYYLGAPTRGELAAVLGKLPSYVAKPTHLSRSACVHICARGRDPRTGRACPGPEEAAAALVGCLSARPVAAAGGGLHRVAPRIVVEEYIADPTEVKFNVVWGRVATAKVLEDYTRRGVGLLSRRGTWAPLPGGAPPHGRGLPPHYGWMVAVAERLARGTDLLRVDFLCGGGRCVVGELTPPPSNSRILPGAEALIARLLLDGHEVRKRTGWKGGWDRPAPREGLGPAFAHFGPRYWAMARARAEQRPWGGYPAAAAARAAGNHPAQVVYEDKLRFYSLLDSRGLPHPRVFAAFEAPADRKEVLLALEGRESFALKPTNLAMGEGVVLWDRGRDLHKDVPLTRQGAADRAIAALGVRMSDEVTEALGWVRPRLVLEELVPVEFEAKWMTFWGRPLVARIMVIGRARRRRKDAASPYLGSLYPDGTFVPKGRGGAPRFPTAGLPLAGMLATVAAAAEGTDHLRVDLMVRPGGFTVGECAVFTEPPFFQEAPELEALFAELLLTGHSGRQGGGPSGSAPGGSR